jgi:phosphohistidine phosphatase
MILYLARHGTASKPSVDQSSILTSRGESDVRQTALRLKEKGVRLAYIWHSPKTRALQTAAIYLKVLGNPETLLEEKKWLSPDNDAETILEQILLENRDSLFIVGHLPYLEKLAFLLLENPSSNASLTFPPASVGCFRRKLDLTWECSWLINPVSQ